MALTFLTGGARSGKSARAVLMAEASGRDVTFVATAQARDAEMADRIRLHRAERPADWAAIEAPLDLELAIAGLGAESAGIIDCLSLWVSNLLERGDSAEQIEAAADLVATACVASVCGLDRGQQRGRHGAGSARPGQRHLLPPCSARPVHGRRARSNPR